MCRLWIDLEWNLCCNFTFNGPKSILELGTAIGYSSIRMMQAIPNSRIVTVERNRERYEKHLNI